MCVAHTIHTQQMLVKWKGDHLILLPCPPTNSICPERLRFGKGNEACLRNPKWVCEQKANAESLRKKMRSVFFWKVCVKERKRRHKIYTRDKTFGGKEMMEFY